ncbi:MAG: Tfp pilus assembly protein FimT/FimU [Phycisphaerae bacterium]
MTQDDSAGSIPRRRRCRVRGFTLIELAIALSLLVLLGTIAWPALRGRIKAAELPDSADRIRSMLFMVRSQAVMEHRRYRVRFEPEAQQPIIEYEVDPIRDPGTWEPVRAGWVEDRMLLGDVQVHEVQLGRPIWTRPLSENDQPGEQLDDPNSQEEPADSQLDEVLLTPSATAMDDLEIDENRPPIVFEVDGSSDWAVLMLARVKPEDELEEETKQLWAVLDGRTGLAKIREKITEDQLADPDFYIARAKLELPDTVDLDNLTLTATDGPIDSGGGDELKLGNTGPGGGGSDSFGTGDLGNAFGGGLDLSGKDAAGPDSSLGGLTTGGRGSRGDGVADLGRRAGDRSGNSSGIAGRRGDSGRAGGRGGSEGRGGLGGGRSGLGGSRAGGGTRAGGNRGGSGRNANSGSGDGGRPGSRGDRGSAPGGNRGNDRNGGAGGDRGSEPADSAQDDRSQGHDNGSDLDQKVQEALQQLDEALANTDLSESEAAQIRAMFEQILRNESGG